MRVDLLCSEQHLERVNICVQVAKIAKQKLAALSLELIENDGKGVDDDDDDEGLWRAEQKIWETHKMHCLLTNDHSNRDLTTNVTEKKKIICSIFQLLLSIIKVDPIDFHCMDQKKSFVLYSG